MIRDTFFLNTRRLIFAIFIALVVILILVGIVSGLLITRPVPTYYSVTEVEKVQKLHALQVPNLSNRAILAWARMAVLSAYTYNYVNFAQVFNENKQYFTAAGWKSFLASLKASGALDTVQTKKLIITAVLSGPPIVRSQYVVQGNRVWTVQLPLLVTFESMSERNDQKYLVTLTMRRVSTFSNLHGIGISQFVVESM